jgi:hypothetical protein
MTTKTGQPTEPLPISVQFDWDREKPSLTLSKINLIAFDVRDGKADPIEAKALMREYLAYSRLGLRAPDRLHQHLADCFERFLERNWSLSSAFGLNRNRAGHPEQTIEKERQTALVVLRAYLGGASLTKSVEQAMETCHRGERQVRKAWRNHKREAHDDLRMKRPDASPWSDKERARLLRIFKGSQKIPAMHTAY